MSDTYSEVEQRHEERMEIGALTAGELIRKLSSVDPSEIVYIHDVDEGIGFPAHFAYVDKEGRVTVAGHHTYRDEPGNHFGPLL